MGSIRPCRAEETDALLAIINAAAEAYRGVIPADRWREPYMDRAGLEAEIAAGVQFSGFSERSELIAVMGVQSVRGVDLIRHAYVRPDRQRRGAGTALLRHLLDRSTTCVLVGTWAAAGWAIAFYRRHGFELVSADVKTELLETYWTIPERQVETSVVLARPADCWESAA
jgi:GNAT superfamily N-acetyltransferase